MNEHDLFEAIGRTDENLLEASERRPPQRWRAYLAAAACLLVILSTALIALRPQAPEPSSPTTLPGQNIMMGLPGQIISTETINWLHSSNIYASTGQISGSVLAIYGYEYQFCIQLSVEARVLEVLPGKYQYPSDHTNGEKFRILYMELLDAIYAPNMPSHFYYLLPENLSAELDRFDSLVLTVEQIGCENVMMRNATDKRMETFSFLFRSGHHDPHRGAVIACTGGKLDMSLHQLKGWEAFSGWAEALTTPGKYPPYPGKRDDSVQNIKAAIVQGVEDYKDSEYFAYYRSVISNADLNWPDAQAVLEWVTPFKNGSYSVIKYGLRNPLMYIRYVNGIETNESISVDLETKTVTKLHPFSDEDLQNLPSLDFYITTAALRPSPARHNSNQEPYRYCGAKGEYRKEGNTVFGIVSIFWGDPDVEESERHADCIVQKIQETTYLLVYPNGKAAEAEDYGTLKALIADYIG